MIGKRIEVFTADDYFTGRVVGVTRRGTLRVRCDRTGAIVKVPRDMVGA